MWFGCDMERIGSRLFLHLVYQVAIHRPMREVIGEMMKDNGYTRTVLYCCMKNALRPVLNASAEQLAEVGLPPLREGTITELAAAMATLT